MHIKDILLGIRWAYILLTLLNFNNNRTWKTWEIFKPNKLWMTLFLFHMTSDVILREYIHILTSNTFREPLAKLLLGRYCMKLLCFRIKLEKCWYRSINYCIIYSIQSKCKMYSSLHQSKYYMFMSLPQLKLFHTLSRSPSSK